MSEDTASRFDVEWTALNAFRDLLKVASKGDTAKSTYNNALDFGGALYPELLGREASLLSRARESDTTREYRQRAELLSVREKKAISPLALVRDGIEDLKGLLSIAEQDKSEDRGRVDQLKRKLNQLVGAERDLNPVAHSEHQLIFRDAYNVERAMPSLRQGRGHRDFELPDAEIERLYSAYHVVSADNTVVIHAQEF
jgi:hypothetical protein